MFRHYSADMECKMAIKIAMNSFLNIKNILYIILHIIITLRALIFAGIKCCSINFCRTNFCDFSPKSQKLVLQMFPNSSNRKNSAKFLIFFHRKKKFKGEPINNIFDILDDLQINLLLYTYRLYKRIHT